MRFAVTGANWANSTIADAAVDSLDQTPHRVIVSMGPLHDRSNLFAFLGQFTVYTFVSLLSLSSGARPALVGPILLACGACGLLSLWWAGRNLDRSPRRTAVVVLALVVSAVIGLGGMGPALLGVIVAAVVWNGAFGGLPSIYQACAVRTHAVSPELAGAWVNATANAGIAGGAAIGAGLLQSAGLWSLPWVGASLILVGLAVILLSRKAFPSQTWVHPAALGRSGGQLPCGSTANSKCHSSFA